MKVIEGSAALPDNGTWLWVTPCSHERSALGRAVTHCGFPLATTEAHGVHTGQ